MYMGKRKILSCILSLFITIGFSSKAFAIDNTSLGSVDTDKIWVITFNEHINYYSARDNIKVIDEYGNKVDTTITVAQEFAYVLPPDGGYKEGNYTLDINNSLKAISKHKLKNSVKKDFVVKKLKSGGKIGTAPATPSKDTLLDEYGYSYIEGREPYHYVDINTPGQRNAKYRRNEKYTDESIEVHFRVPYNQNFINQINNEKGKVIICSDEQAKNRIEMSVQAENRNGETVLILNNDNKVVFPRGDYYIFFRDEAGNYELNPFSYIRNWYYNKDGLKVYINLSRIDVFVN